MMNSDKEYQKGKIVEGHEFDGIKELDNPPPPWLMYVFYASVFFSVLYWGYFHAFNQGPDQYQEYEMEVAAASAIMDAGTAQLVPETAAVTNPADIAAGKALFASKACFACHGMNGEGNAVGPNLTDDFTLHGCDLPSIVKIIKTGVPAKGMTPYEGQLSVKEIDQLAKYIQSLRGSKPANAKAPQGEKCK
jgi:cytochrome c oxidase cbb3-type subunit 3